MGEGLTCRYEPEAARELGQRENREGGVNVCASSRRKAGRAADLTATWAAAAAVSTLSMGLSNPK